MCHHDEQPHPGLKGAALTASLRAAELRCLRNEEQLTKPRKRVLQLLLQSDAPMKGYDLIAAFATDGKPTGPPTVYRALEFLGRMGLVHRLESLNAFVACRLEDAEHRAAFLICDCCGTTKEFEPSLAAAGDAAKQLGYTLHSITIEAHGRCAACSA
ncbi:Fur family transcriptional regulator [Phenylobacterium sp.]|uniref:Fur family transcriptional regulator n=1 Tax=Phenylobacterium sp. TaxID=1871053 RepID=UPI002DE2EB0A|nr:Fur family transcriptional regulator [Phenylobacterium sp.]